MSNSTYSTITGCFAGFVVWPGSRPGSRTTNTGSFEKTFYFILYIGTNNFSMCVCQYLPLFFPRFHIYLFIQATPYMIKSDVFDSSFIPKAGSQPGNAGGLSIRVFF